MRDPKSGWGRAGKATKVHPTASSLQVSVPIAAAAAGTLSSPPPRPHAPSPPFFFCGLASKATITTIALPKFSPHLACHRHPDKHPDNQEEAKSKFQIIQKAYDALMSTDEEEIQMQLAG